MIVLASVSAAAAVVSQGLGRAAARDWALERSVSNELGGTMDFVVVPEQRRGDRPHYEAIAV